PHSRRSQSRSAGGNTAISTPSATPSTPASTHPTVRTHEGEYPERDRWRARGGSPRARTRAPRDPHRARERRRRRVPLPRNRVPPQQGQPVEPPLEAGSRRPRHDRKELPRQTPADPRRDHPGRPRRAGHVSEANRGAGGVMLRPDQATQPSVAADLLRHTNGAILDASTFMPMSQGEPWLHIVAFLNAALRWTSIVAVLLLARPGCARAAWL